jgi:hypothetical protein
VFELTTLVVIGTDYTGSCKSNYHAITATTALIFWNYISLIVISYHIFGVFLYKSSNLFFQEDGFYVECCSSDGEKGSNSLFFERVRKWNGLVMVTEPENMSSLQQKNRKAMTLNSCISVTDKPQKVL